MLRMMRRWVGLAFVLGTALVALAACSAAELQPAAPLKADPDTGIVILSVTRSGARDFDLFVWLTGPGQWSPRSIVMRAHSLARDWRGGASRDATPADDPEGRLVVLALPPGTYRIDRWNGESESGGFYGDGYDIDGGKLDLSFTVEPGSVTYLGSLHIQLPSSLNFNANLMTATYRMSVEDKRQRDMELARARYADGPAADAVASLPVQFPQAGQDIRYYIHNRKVGSGDFAMLRRP